MPSSSELALRVVAEREPGSRIWSFYLVNDGAGAIGASELAAVRYEWGDQYVGGESPATKIASIGSGGRALIWRDDGSSEMRTDLWVRVTHDCQEAWLVFAFPRLYRQTGTSLVAVASRMPGPPGALP